MKLFDSIGYEFSKLFFGFLALSPLSFSQTFPIQKIDSTFKSASNTLMISEEIKEYDEYIVHATYSSWTKEHMCYFLGSKNGEWHAYIFFIDYNTDHYRTQTEYEIKKKKIRIKNSRIDKMYAFLNSSGFWDLNRDSLNQRTRRVNDGLIELLIITDGSTDVFFVFSEDQHFKTAVYMVDYYHELCPNKQKSTFIISRNNFISLFQKKSITQKRLITKFGRRNMN